MKTPTAMTQAIALIVALSMPTQAQTLSAAQTAEATDFAMHDAVFTMYH
tara:strand:- start:24124 stop:24270 length:147 start_codon:yes stop_codon:yes gene_type:complete